MQARLIFEGYGLISTSPDGSLVALEGNPRGHIFYDPYNEYSLSIAKFNEGEPLLISSSYCGSYVGWSADSKWISFPECFPEEQKRISKLYDLEAQRTIDYQGGSSSEYRWLGSDVPGTQLGVIPGPNLQMDLSDLPVSIPEVLPSPGKVSGILVHYLKLPDKQRVLVFLEFYENTIEDPGTPNEREIMNIRGHNSTFYVVSNEGKLLKEISLEEFMPSSEFFKNYYLLNTNYPVSSDSQWFATGTIEDTQVVLWLVNLTTGEIQKIPTTASWDSHQEPFIDWVPSSSSPLAENQAKTPPPAPVTVDLKSQNAVSLPIESFSVYCWKNELDAGRLGLFSNGVIARAFEVAEPGSYVITIPAKGSAAEGEFAKLVVKINGEVVGEIETSGDWKNYTVTPKLEVGKADLVIEFSNDRWKPDTNEDRNAWIGNVEIIGVSQ